MAATYARLQAVDPLRAGYYKDAAEGRAFVVVQALGHSEGGRGGAAGRGAGAGAETGTGAGGVP